jgi:hypothetical protein
MRSRVYSRPVIARAALLCLLVAAPAYGNGRPPATNGIALHPKDPHALYVRSTFGLLVSKDDGCSFRWICEKAIGYGGEFDPKYAIADDGTIFATTFKGLRVSRDGGCSWATATSELPKGPGKISDIWIDALDIASDGTVWVATAESARANDVYSSADNGVTFTPRGQLSQTIWWKSVKAAKSDPQRIYLAGYQVAGTLPGGGPAPPMAFLRRSSDGGATWTELELFGSQRNPPNMKFGQTPIVLIAAVDPKAPDHVLLTSIGAAGAKGDRLYRSTDAGYSFTEVLVTTDTIRDAVFAQDGSVYVASLGATYRSTDNAASFTRLAGTPQLACLGQRADGKLVGCGANWEPDFKAVAVSSDSASWSKTFRFVELAGPLGCAPGTTSQIDCDPLWPSLQQQFGATGPTACNAPPDGLPEPPPPPDSGCCDASGNVPAFSIVLALGLLVVLRRVR